MKSHEIVIQAKKIQAHKKVVSFVVFQRFSTRRLVFWAHTHLVVKTIFLPHFPLNRFNGNVWWWVEIFWLCRCCEMYKISIFLHFAFSWCHSHEIVIQDKTIHATRLNRIKLCFLCCFPTVFNTTTCLLGTHTLIRLLKRSACLTLRWIDSMDVWWWVDILLSWNVQDHYILALCFLISLSNDLLDLFSVESIQWQRLMMGRKFLTVMLLWNI